MIIDFKSHTGVGTTYGAGITVTVSRKQKLNSRISTEYKLVRADDVSTLILWTKIFMEAQGYDTRDNILSQENKSKISLETNGKSSSSNRTRAINIRYSFLIEQIQKGKLAVEY